MVITYLFIDAFWGFYFLFKHCSKSWHTKKSSLKAQMEANKLDLNQPILSVRRFPAPIPTPEDDDNKIRADQCFPSVPPQLPITHYKSDLKSGPVTHPGTVPFRWEQAPGTPKEGANPRTTPVLRLPPLYPQQQVAGSQTKDAGDGEEEEEAYVDALETLSLCKTETFFLNCSESGLGIPDPNSNPQQTTDPVARDSMMGRFLPAARAIASETSQFAVRKDREKQRYKIKVVRTKITTYFGPNQAGNINESNDLEEDSSDEESEIMTKKGCGGIFPRFCLRNPFLVMNQIPICSAHRTTRFCTRGKSHGISEPDNGFSSSKLGTQKNGQCTFGELLASHGKDEPESPSDLVCMDSVHEAAESVSLDTKPSDEDTPSYPRFPATSTPPLPQSPSESWLGRTLPSIGPRKVPSSRPSSYFLTQDKPSRQ